ncbi:MAG: hypothetical protein J0626_05420, partial [Rhodospirillaceae bacterium]|nr:hypothetical protein [Rhodospirillaceae bacterium]
NHAVTAVYSGDGSTVGVTSAPFDQQVLKNIQSIGSISLTPVTVAVGGTTVASATATSGLAVSFSSLTPDICTVSDATVTALTGGSCIIAADQGGNASYNAALQTTWTITVAKASATVTLGSLSQSYDGTARTATAFTSPVGKTVVITYTGSGGTSYGPSTTAPVNSGTYGVSAVISDSTWQGSSSGTLIVSKAAATVTLGNLSQTYDGAARWAVYTTTPGGLVASVTYDGSSTAPVAAGSYAVTATISDVNYTGSASGTLTIDKTTATVTLGNLFHTYNGAAKAATAVTSPTGKSVTITYNGSATVPTGVGSYTVLATISDGNYSGSITGLMTIGKAAQAISFGGVPGVSVGGSGTVSATATSGGLVTFISLTREVCGITGTTTVIGKSAGTCTIAAN